MNERFTAFLQVNDTTGEELLEILPENLEILCLSTEDCRGQGNASGFLIFSRISKNSSTTLGFSSSSQRW